VLVSQTFSYDEKAVLKKSRWTVRVLTLHRVSVNFLASLQLSESWESSDQETTLIRGLSRIRVHHKALFCFDTKTPGLSVGTHRVTKWWCGGQRD
jgi:hypothetical protein